MSAFEQLKTTFFDEASEGLVNLEAGLTEIRDDTGTEDTVHAIFRAVHSIKGGAGVFGFTELIEFSHVFETVLDAIRHGDLPPTPDVTEVLFLANDTLSDLVGMARAGQSVEPGFGSECRAALEQLMLGDSLREAKAAGNPGEAPQDDFADFSFTPVRVDGADDAAEPLGMNRFSIEVRPSAEMIKKGIEPQFFFNTLRSLGTLDLVADTQALPAISAFDAEQAYIGWTACLETASPRSDLDAIFAPIMPICDIKITDLTAGVEPAAVPAPGLVAAAGFAEPQPIGLPPGMATAAAPAPAAPAFKPVPASAAVPAPAFKPVPAPAAVPAPTPMAATAPAAAAPAPNPEPPVPNPEPPTADSAPQSNSKESRAAAAKAAAATTIRVELEKIDRVVNMVGELVIAQAMLGQAIENLPEEASGKVSNILGDLVRHTRGLKDSVMAIRAQPVGSVFQRMPRLVRELSLKTGKKVQIETYGESTEVDKTIIERLSDPLTHIIRNSIDHGIEAPDVRVANGKSETGLIRLSADQRGGRIVIEISDDGAGINCQRVLQKARDKGLVDPNATLTDEEICNLIFLPGFSTAQQVSDISGRGVGMDVVRRNIQDLGGRTSIKSEPGRGMMIQLALPLTLAVMDGMVVEVGKETYVLPIPNIVECLRPSANEIHHLLGTAGTLQLRGDVVPLVHLGSLLGVQAISNDKNYGVVIITEASDGTRLGLIVDELCGHQQVVIKSIEENCGAVQGIAGATVLGDGHVAFILDVEMLSDMTTETRYPGVPGQRMSGSSAIARAH